MKRSDSETLQIRAATESDLEPLLQLYQHLNPGDQSPGLDDAAGILRSIARYPGSDVLIGFCGETIAASCTVIVIPNLTRGGAPYALIENVVTDPAFRNRGFGQAILGEAVSVAWSHGCYKAMLMTGSRKPSTLAFYQRVGFEQTKTGFQMRRIPARPE